MAKIASLNGEDLSRWRVVTAEKELVDLVFPGLSVDDGRRGLLSYYKVLGDLILDYSVATEDGAIYISPIDGGIYSIVRAQ